MLQNAMAVLKLFTASRRELGVVEIAELLDRPKSTVSGWLSAMEETGFLERDGRWGPYRVGIEVAALGEVARRSTSLQIAAQPHLERLGRRSKETVTANALLGMEVVNVAVVESPRPILQAAGLGIPMPLHVTAAGKVLLAWLKEEEVLRLLPMRLERFTERTITDLEEFVQELERTRERGYSVARGEMAEDLCTLSAPVRDHTGAVMGAITLGGPVSRVSVEKLSPLAELVMEAAAGVSASLGHAGSAEESAAVA